MKKNDIVKDDEGNHFRILKVGWGTVRCESVATKEVFDIPEEELHETDRVAF